MPESIINKSLSRLLLGAALLYSQAGIAQEARWFQVELLVFSHHDGDTAEIWNATPKLAYPETVRFLVEQQQVNANTAQYGGDSNIDPYGRQLIGFAPDVDEQSPPEAPVTGSQVDPVLGAATDTETAAATVPAVEPTGEPAFPTAFVTLPSSQLEFRGKAAYMQRSGRYDILFHEAWRQPMLGEKSTLPIVLDRSGDTQQWPTLQGSVKLYLSRYLHLQTNLWLNTSGRYLNSTWRMPAPPLGPPSLIVEQAPEPEDVAEPVVLEDMLASDEALQENPEELEPLYPYRHAVLLQQKRRMRSDEVHYIDHPMLGVIVKITRVAEDESDQLAGAD